MKIEGRSCEITTAVPLSFERSLRIVSVISLLTIGSRPGRGLVVEHQGRPGNDGARETRALEHAPRKFGRQIVVGVSEPDAIERIEDRLANLRLRELRVLAQRKGDVIADAEAIEQRRELKRKADLLPHDVDLLFRQVAQIAAEHVDVAFVGQQQPVEQPQNRRFTGAREPDHAGDGPFDDVEAAVL